MNLSDLVLDPNDFEDIRDIGNGQFGVVRLVKNKNDGSEYALKQIPEESQDNDAQKLFMREILTLRTLDHPAILKINGFSIRSQSDKSYYIFTEFMPNGNLKEMKIKEKDDDAPEKFNPTTKTICVIGIAAGMKYVHSAKIMHRDLKPENIFFDENFYPRIADFGLARLFEGTNGKITSNLGTPYFMAPELFDDDEITDAIDVYAFGVLILSMFDPDFKFDAAKPPKNISQLVSHIRKGKRFLIPEDVPDAYKKLITDCWNTDPKDRPTFKKIYDELTKDDSYYLEDSDENEISDYIKMINDFMNNKEEEEEEDAFEETKEFDFS